MSPDRLLLPLALLLLTSSPARAQDLLVTSRTTDEVLRYDASTGAFLGVFASGGGLDNPVGLTYGPDGHLYVASALTGRVIRYDGQSGALLGTFTSGGGPPDPRQLNFGPDGDLYVASGSGDRILRYDGTTGVRVSLFAQGGGLDGPTSFTFGPTGDLYVVSVLTSEVLRYDGTTGAFLQVFASAGLAGPHDVSFGPDGDLYVSNAFSKEVLRFDGRTGAPLGVFIDDPALQFALGLTWSRDGHLLVVNQGANEVRRYDGRTGAFAGVLVSAGAGGLASPLFAALTPLPGGLQVAATAVTAGQRVDLELGGARPGSRLFLAAGLSTGRRGVPHCPGALLDLGAPRLLGRAIADESGCARLRWRVPLGLASTPIRFQAWDAGTCSLSPVLVQVFP